MTLPKLTITRLFKNTVCTLGYLAKLNSFISFTLEPAWKNNKKAISSIPAGTYLCTPHNGSKYKGTWIVNGVPNRSGVVFHVGNRYADTKGCFLLGRNFKKDNNEYILLDSKLAMDDMREMLKNCDRFYLEVKDV